MKRPKLKPGDTVAVVSLSPKREDGKRTLHEVSLDKVKSAANKKIKLVKRTDLEFDEIGGLPGDANTRLVLVPPAVLSVVLRSPLARNPDALRGLVIDDALIAAIDRFNAQAIG